ncbi:hypothetical protein F5Y05DRAFT_414280 [Hypoxylon sp. FL0543]|nr:hypothetical protein F5Y05DRAFT_414280 [Hypoxylon sp. FL0543]
MRRGGRTYYVIDALSVPTVWDGLTIIIALQSFLGASLAIADSRAAARASRKSLKEKRMAGRCSRGLRDCDMPTGHRSNDGKPEGTDEGFHPCTSTLLGLL